MIERAVSLSAGSMKELAAEIGVSYDAVWKWMHGQRTPSPENLRRLADVLEERGEALGGCADRLREFADGRGADPGG